LPQDRKVGIYKIVYPIYSETFITSQAMAFKSYESLVLARTKVGETPLSLLALSDSDPTGIRQKWMAITRTPSFFLKDERVKKLSLLHSHFGPCSVYALPLAQRLSIPLISTFHGLDTTANPWRYFLQEFGVTSFNYFLHLCDLKKSGAAFIAVSDFIRDCLIAKGFPQERVHLMYIGVDTRRYCPAPTESGLLGNRYILNVARHVPVKGVDTLLRAFSLIADRFPRVSLLQVGTGPLTGSLQTLVQKLGLTGRVRFLGMQSEETVLGLMQRADILALTSQTAENGAREALGMVLNEASSCGVAIAATRSGGIPEAVIDGETGLLSPERNIRLLADNLECLLADGELRGRLGRQGREYVRDKFCIQTQTAKLERFYDQVVEEWHLNA
jgi:colanic acid/amylovoran biosynthesis glycosyltransferase